MSDNAVADIIQNAILRYVRVVDNTYVPNPRTNNMRLDLDSVCEAAAHAAAELLARGVLPDPPVRIRRFAPFGFVLALALAAPGLALAQSTPVAQEGVVLLNDLTKYTRNGLVRNPGGLLGDNNGSGVNPFAITDFMALGLCLNSDKTNAAIYSTLCMGHDITGNGLLEMRTVGAANLALKVFPGSGMIVGSPTGGAKGAGTINAVGLYVNGASVISPLANRVSNYGADVLGVLDATSALNACLVGVGAGATCEVDPGAILNIQGNITIPAHTTLKCGDALPSSDDNPAGWASMPALRVAAAAQIGAGGQAVTIDGCLIYPGFTLPQTVSSGWTGKAVTASGNVDLTVVNSTIFGYNICIDGVGSNRLRINNVLMDCKGGSLGGATEGALMSGSTGDSPRVTGLRIQPLAMNNGSCTASLREGNGWITSDQAVFADNVVVQNFKTSQIFANGGGFYAGEIWLDGLNNANAACAGLTAIGLKAVNAEVHIQHLNINGQNVAMRINNNSPWRKTMVSDLFLNATDTVCIQAGGIAGAAGAGGGGSIIFDNITTNANSSSNCVSYALDYLDTTNSTYVEIKSGTLVGVRAGSGPYIHTATGVSISANTQIRLGNIVTDLEVLKIGSLMSGPTTQACLGVTAAAATYFTDHGTCFAVHGSGNITSFTGVWDSRRLTLVLDSGIAIINGGNINTAGGATFTASAGSLIEFFCYAGVCKETGRNL